MSECHIKKDGTKIWIKRIDENEEDFDVQFWYFYAFLHRLDGPAVEHVNGDIEYWINGVPMSEIEYFIKFGHINS